MKALELLYNYLDVAITMDDPTEDIDEAIKELEELQNSINVVIEEIDYALANPDYAESYLGNAKRFLMEI